MAIQYPQPMSKGVKVTVYTVFGTLWASGCFWLVLHLFFARGTDFGPLQHPWQPATLRVHGWIAVGSVFLLGWITARHVSERWPLMTKRPSGLSMASMAVILAVTGYALYYTTDRLHDFAADVHEIAGGAAILLAVTHWRRYRPRGPVTRLGRRGASQNAA